MDIPYKLIYGLKANNGYEKKKGLMLTLSFGFHTQDEAKISPDRF